jgi:hypothetical protein
MKRLCVTMAGLLLLGGAAVAQTSGGTAGSAPGAAPGSTTAPPGSFNPTPNTTVTPGITTPSQPGGGTIGSGGNINPSNPQDKLGRSNPQDMTSPRAKNPQDGGSGTVPQIMVPER